MDKEKVTEVNRGGGEEKTSVREGQRFDGFCQSDLILLS